MIKFIILPILFIFQALSLRSQDLVVYSPEQLKQDFSIFRKTLIEAHPGLYRYQSKKEVTDQFASVEKKLNRSMTEKEFFRLLNPVVANIRCSHTKFHRDGKPDDPYAFHQQGLFPLKLYFQPNEKVYVLSSFIGETAVHPGYEIVRINGKSIREIKELLFKQITADGHVTSSKYQELNQFFPGYYANFVGIANHFFIDFKKRDSEKTFTQKLRAADLLEISHKEQTANSSSPFHLSYPKLGVALMKIDVFVADEDQFENFMSTSFSEIKARDIQHLILDLRNNEGGMDRFGARLYARLSNQPFRYYDRLTVASMPPYSFAAYASLPEELEQLKMFIKKQGDEFVFTQNPNFGLQQPEADPFTGKLYILQNGRSLSVTSEFVAVVCDNDRGIFIGEESGGTISGNNSGGFALVKLPNTKLGLDVPLLGYYMFLQHSFPMDRGIVPKHLVSITVNDMLGQKDPVFEKALQLIYEVK